MRRSAGPAYSGGELAILSEAVTAQSLYYVLEINNKSIPRID